MRSIGWQILKCLEFLHSKGLPHGDKIVGDPRICHKKSPIKCPSGGLHLGNIFLHKEQVVVSGLASFIGGLSGRVRTRAVRVKVTLGSRAGNEPLRSLKFHNYGEGPY